MLLQATLLGILHEEVRAYITKSFTARDVTLAWPS